MHIFKAIYELFIVLLVFTYAIFIFADPSKHPYISDDMIKTFDYWLIAFFIIEFSVRLYKADNKKKFLKSNWFDIIAMIPFDHIFRFARFLRVVRLFRILESSRFIEQLKKSKQIKIPFLVVMLIIVWSSCGVFFLEKGVNDSIQDFGDAVWWAIVTTTTVGYGDISPVTSGGRVIAGFLMMTGLFIIAVLTSFFSSHWTSYFESNDDNVNKVEKQLKENVEQWVKGINNLSEDEYKTLIKSLEILRGEKNE